ncbi:ImuA family protein [Roseiconus lacunae]|uniref:ImuA family protein n=1 Tax=Roseiconus lacunae TaxID=2605694 RepID=UPI001E5F83DC|nr:hypothetical protein [Roseiconus lacunae]MCD0462119.1 hypothetical protein [Roseiconus lacunae]
MAIEQQLFSFMEARSGGAKTDLMVPATARSSKATTEPAALAVGDESTIQQDAIEEDPPRETRPASRQEVLQALRSKVGCVNTARESTLTSFSTGCDAIDAWLPGNGLHPASLTEWIAAHDSAAAESMALVAAAHRITMVPTRPLVIVDCEGSFYPPAAVALGIPAERMILLRPRNSGDAIWSIDQSLRSGAVAAVVARLPMRLDDRDGRRLQLASESGTTPGLLVRNFQARQLPSFAETQFYVAEKRRPVFCAGVGSSKTAPHNRPRMGRVSGSQPSEILSITLDRVRGGVTGKHLHVRFDDHANLHSVPISNPQRHETAAKRLASQLAHPTTAKRVATASPKRAVS